MKAGGHGALWLRQTGAGSSGSGIQSVTRMRSRLRPYSRIAPITINDNEWIGEDDS